MKVLVLGGTGFIGSHIVRRLIKDGYSVRCFSRSPNTDFSNEKVEYIYGDYTNYEDFNSLLKDIDIVFHCISSLVPAKDTINEEYEIKANLLPMNRLLKAIRFSQSKKFIFLSSGGAIYGDHGAINVSENMKKLPISLYGVLKLHQEEQIMLESRRYGLKSIIIRPSNPFGPGQLYNKPQGVIAKFLFAMKNFDDIHVYGEGQAVRDYIFIEDLIDACIISMDDDITGTYNIGSSIGYSVNEIINALSFETLLEPNIKYYPQREFDIKYSVLDCKSALNNLKWKPKTSLKKGISITWDSIKMITNSER